MKNESSSTFAISKEFITILKQENDKVYEVCVDINATTNFSNSLSSLSQEKSEKSLFKAEHVLLRDLLKIFNTFFNLSQAVSAIPLEARFALIYSYEKLQGKDLSLLYDLKRLNQLTLSTHFNQNVQLIRETVYFKAIPEMENEYVLPAILSTSKNKNFAVVTSFLSRVATLFAKADNTISADDEEKLKVINKKINQPKINLNNATYNEIPENDSLEKVLSELNELIGLDEVKNSIQDMTNFLKIQKIREEKGLKTSVNSLHSVFMGPPGTGKTTIARLLGRIYKHLGYLEKGHLIETDRAGMVAGYVGQTAIKADEIINSAIGGVLFIDEAYSLTSGGFNDFGNEAIEILLKRMEDLRTGLVVIVAGYPDEMEEFITSNPGLHSRFNRYFKFDHLSAPTMIEIFKIYAKKADFLLSADAEEKLMEIIDRLFEKRNKNFGNARTIRNLFEKIIERQANRIISITPLTESILKTITEDDIPEILKTVNEILVFENEE